MKPEKNFFPIGATYAPLPKATEVDISEWPQDIANMKGLGLNTFRLFLCWDRVEMEHGKRDFSRIDRAFDLAEENGLKVIGNVGGTFTNLQAIYPPRWLVYDLGCTLLKEKPDAPGELHFNRFKLCYDDPKYQQAAKDFIQEAVSRYKNRPSLIAWSGWNEPRLSECYCRHTAEAFRKWLGKKYGSLERLAKAWSTEFPVYFRSWDDVFPQLTANFEAGGYIPYLDWRRFLEQNRSDKFHMIRQWIREMDPSTPVISHLCGPYNADIFGEEDILGTSVYTIHAQGKGGDYSPYEFTFRQNVQFMPEGRRSHREDPEGFWVVETEAGPVSWVHNLVPRSYSPRKMNARDMYLIAHGARAVLRWLYRSRISDAQAGEFNMTGWDGRITERAEAFGRLAKFVTEHSELFLSHTSEKSGVLILDSQDCDSLAECEGYQSRYSNSIHYLYNAFLHIGVPVFLQGELHAAVLGKHEHTRGFAVEPVHGVDAVELGGFQHMFLEYGVSGELVSVVGPDRQQVFLLLYHNQVGVFEYHPHFRVHQFGVAAFAAHGDHVARLQQSIILRRHFRIDRHLPVRQKRLHRIAFHASHLGQQEVHQFHRFRHIEAGLPHSRFSVVHSH